MSEVRIISIKKNIHEDNKKLAEQTRQLLKEQKTYFINVMSSPGSGKTTTLVSTIEALKSKMKIGVLEADVDSDVDAKTVMEAGAKAIQMHTGGLCHLDATMTRSGLDELGMDECDLIFLENIGNLICPVGYDTGAMKNVAILSVPEGDDKPLKYPMIFAKVDALIINKIDVMEHFDFNMELLEKRVRELNKDIVIFPLSAKTKEGMSAWTQWVEKAIKGEV